MKENGKKAMKRRWNVGIDRRWSEGVSYDGKMEAREGKERKGKGQKQRRLRSLFQHLYYFLHIFSIFLYVRVYIFVMDSALKN